MTTEAMRAAFEAWMGQGTDFVRIDPTSGAYRNVFVDGRWDAWQAATLAERERCAVLCMTFDDTHEANRGHGPEICAEAIRKGEAP